MAILNPEEFPRRVVESLLVHGGSDVTLLDLRGLTVIADHFVIGTVETSTQMRAFRDTMDSTLAAESAAHPRFEGVFEDGWVLADFGATIVHVFSPDARAHYRLEELWAEAPTILHVQ